MTGAPAFAGVSLNTHSTIIPQLNHGWVFHIRDGKFTAEVIKTKVIYQLVAVETTGKNFDIHTFGQPAPAPLYHLWYRFTNMVSIAFMMIFNQSSIKVNSYPALWFMVCGHRV